MDKTAVECVDLGPPSQTGESMSASSIFLSTLYIGPRTPHNNLRLLLAFPSAVIFYEQKEIMNVMAIHSLVLFPQLLS